jgi:uncharacterized protein YdeI (BOF family)
MRKTFLLVYVVVFLFAGVATAFAAVMTVSQALSSSAGTEATLTGAIGFLGENKFTITDTAGDTIAFECGPAWYKTAEKAALTAGDITVTGEVELGKDGTTKLEAYSVKSADGSTTLLDVRPGAGKPPWAGTKSQGKNKGGSSTTVKPVEDNCTDDKADDKPDKVEDPADKD